MIFAPIGRSIWAPVSGAIGQVSRLAPALIHNFYTATLDGAALARPSIGTRTNSALTQVTEFANVARFDYDPASGVLRGVLDEGAATNIVLQSGDMMLAPWTYPVGTGKAVAPDGSATATLITTVGGSQAAHYQVVTVTPGTTLTWSEYVKLGTLSAADFKIAFYNETSGAFISTDLPPNVALNSSTFTRLSWQVTVPAGCTSMRCYALRATPASNATVFVWGAQLEVGSAATSYTPTTTVAATRAADTLTTTLAYPCDVLIQDRNGAEWRDNQSAGALVIPARAGQRHVGVVTAYTAGALSPNAKAAMAVAA